MAGHGNQVAVPQNPDQFAFLSQHGMVRTEEGNGPAEAISTSLINGMGCFGNDTEIVAIHQNSNSGPTGQARLERFRTFSRAVGEKCGGNANIKHAWYGATKDEICQILSHGFSSTGGQAEEDGYGLGVCLSHVDFPINAALSSLADENDLRHILLCQVIVGNMEEIWPGSEQSEPSSEHFDSGVDDLSAPTRHIIWCAYMNSHILPRYVVSFRAPTLRSLETIQAGALVPNPPCTDIPALMSRLSTFLTRSSMVVIENYHAEFQENRISQVQLIGKMRQLGGDNLLSALIRLINRNEQL